MKRGKPTNRNIDRWIGVPLVWLGSRFHKRRSRPTNPKRIGILAALAVGDTVLLGGITADLKWLNPDATIVVVCTGGVRGCAEILPGVDEIVEISMSQLPQAIRAIREQKFDVLFDVHQWARLQALLTLTSGARYTVGFSTPGQYRHFGFDLAVPYQSDVHAVKTYQSLVCAAGWPTFTPPFLELKPLSPAISRTLYDMVADRTCVVFHAWPGTAPTVRGWPEHYWVELARSLNLPDLRVILTGGRADKPASERLQNHLLAAGIDCVLSPDLGGLNGLAHLVRAVDAVVTVNTGTMHLAAAAGARTVAINGPTASLRWGPVGAHTVSVDAPVPGCGFLVLGWEFQGHRTDCMEQTRPAAVADAVLSLLESRVAPLTFQREAS